MCRRALEEHGVAKKNDFSLNEVVAASALKDLLAVGEYGVREIYGANGSRLNKTRLLRLYIALAYLDVFSKPILEKLEHIHEKECIADTDMNVLLNEKKRIIRDYLSNEVLSGKSRYEIATMTFSG